MERKLVRPGSGGSLRRARRGHAAQVTPGGRGAEVANRQPACCWAYDVRPCRVIRNSSVGCDTEKSGGFT